MNNFSDFSNDDFPDFSREFFVANNVKTAVFISRNSEKSQNNFAQNSNENRANSTKNILFIHGINGSHFGLLEIAKRAAKNNFRAILVDLPGHGASEIPSWKNLENLRKWFAEIYEILEKNFGKIDKIVAHSFGCYVIPPNVFRQISDAPRGTRNFGSRERDFQQEISTEISEKVRGKIIENFEKDSLDSQNPVCSELLRGQNDKIQNFAKNLIFICPVPSQNRKIIFLKKFLPAIFRLPFATKIYNFVPFSIWRGVKLLHEKNSKKNRARIKFIAKNDAKTTKNQREFQTILAQNIPPKNAKNIFKNVNPAKIIVGKFDKIARENADEIARIFPNSEIFILPSGHMPNVENVREISEIIF